MNPQTKRDEGHWKNLAECFWHSCLRNPHRTAFVDISNIGSNVRLTPSQQNSRCRWPLAWTWIQLGRLCNFFIERLQRQGMQAGEHLASCLPNSLEWIILDLACQTLGYVHVAIDYRESAEVVDRLSRFSAAKFLVTTDEKATQVQNLVRNHRMAGSETSVSPPGCEPQPSVAADYQVLSLQRLLDGFDWPHEKRFHAYSNDSDPQMEGTFLAESSSRRSSSGDGVEASTNPRTNNSGVVGPAGCRTPADLASLEACYVAAGQRDAEQPVQMLFTSGTSGSPKGVLLSHRNLLTNCLAKLAVAPQHSSDLRLNLLPFSHAYARTCELSTWILSTSRLAIAHDWPHLIHAATRIQPTLINLVPYLAEKMVERLDVDPLAFGERLRLLQVGGAALEDRLWERLHSHGLPPLQGYGMTETSPVICSNRAGEQQPGTVGPPVPGVEIHIDDKGVLWTRGPHVMLGYYGNPQATSAVIQHGWICTGDLAELLPNQHLKIVGRQSSRIVLSTGYNISPEVPERRIAADPWVRHVLVVGEGQPCIAALIWIEPNNLPQSLRQAASAEQLLTALVQRFEKRLVDLPRNYIPRKVAIINRELSHSDGTLTRKGSLNRRRLQHILAEVIGGLYASS